MRRMTYGAAVQASILSGNAQDEKLDELLLLDVTPLSLQDLKRRVV